MTFTYPRAFRYLAAAAFCAGPVLCPGRALAFSVSGGDFTMEASVVDNGGGAGLSGGDYSSRASVGQNSMPDNIGISGGGPYMNRAGFYNPPHFIYQSGLVSVVNDPAAGVVLSLPAGSVDKRSFDITLNKSPVTDPLAANPAKIAEANDKLIYNNGLWAKIADGNMSEMAVFDEQGYVEGALTKVGTLTMNYLDSNNDGIVDGTNPPVRVETLEAWRLDEDMGMWTKVTGFTKDASSKSITVNFLAPGVYSLLGALDDSVKDVYVFPVPFRPNGPKAGVGQGQTGADTAAGGITFMNVPQTGTIDIYTLDGRLVRSLQIPSNLVVPQVKWDVRLASGDRVASGVYIWRIASGSNVKTGKLMIIW